jgi:hypothetical protein
VIKLKWKVSSKETGKYASFQKRSWPRAEYPNGSPAAFIRCFDSYSPSRSRGEQPHAPLELWVALYKNGKSFDNRRLIKRANSLQEAKDLIVLFLERNPGSRHPNFRN